MYLTNFIKENEDWEELLTADPYNLKISRDGGYILFKYDQIASDFNIPLVQEARGIIFRESDWKCVCYPFTKFGNYGEAYCPEIDWNTASVQEKEDGCFTQKDRVMLANGTSMEIGKIVKDKLAVEVLSYNPITKKIEPQKVIGWKVSDKTSSINEWRTIYLRGIATQLNGRLSQHCVITPTYNHMIFRQDKNGDIEEVEARYLQKGDILYTPTQGLTNIEKQVVLGTLLGDGSCTYYQETDKLHNKGIRFNHSQTQKKYVEHKAKLLNRIGGKISDTVVDNAYGKYKTCYQSRVNKAINDYYNLTYTNYKKSVNLKWLEELDWLGFAIWYMDDGSLDKGPKNNGVFLHTEGFPDDENQLIVDFYNNKGYKCNLRNDSRGHLFIHFSTESSELIFQQIRQYIIPEMYYKLPVSHQGYFNESIYNDMSIPEIIMTTGYIENIEEGLHAHNTYKAKSIFRYDIEVEDNHNYFCQGVLVHNSLCKLWYDNKWHISTNGTIDARKAKLNSVKYETFYDLFADAMPITLDVWDSIADRNSTYMFELVSPYNRVVIPYKETKLYFLGLRNMITYEEVPPESSIMSSYFDIPKRYNLHSLDDVKNAASKLPWDEEGYVVCDANFNRVKIKSPEYVKAHYARTNNNISLGRLIDIILSGEQEEFLIYASDYAEELHKVEEAMHRVAHDSVVAMRVLFGNHYYQNRGDYASKVMELPNYAKDFLFHCYDERIFWDYAKSWTADKWVKAIEEVKINEFSQ